jgi:hypothetical protein
MQKTGVFLLPLLLILSAAPGWTAEPSPAPAATAVWAFDNPFCEVLAGLVPITGRVPGSEYGLQLYASHGTTVAAHVTLIGSDAAYDANVTVTNLQGATTDRRTGGIVVRLEKAAPIHYFFVDSFSIDGAASMTCPSYVFRAGSAPSSDGITASGLNAVTAAFLEKLPDMPCGKAYTEPSVQKGFDSPVGFYGYQRRSTVLHVFIDSNGLQVRSSIKSSSGVPGLDDAAYAGVQYTRYRPAQFLCTPVVGEIDMQMDYSP